MSSYTNFIIYNKVALVTGGASGIGKSIVQELLKNGAKGVVIVDFNKELGEKVLKEMQNEFGENKSIFVKCDVASVDEFENAFQKGVDTFKALDIVVNNAGIANEDEFLKCISTNLVGVINGINLALNKFLPKYKTENDAVIINTSSIAFISEVNFIPVYSATKAAVASLTRSWGCKEIYDKTNIRVIAICPGFTKTAIGSSLRNITHPLLKAIHESGVTATFSSQTSEQCAQGAIRVIQTAPSGTLWIVEGGEIPYEYNFSPRELQKPTAHSKI